MAPVCVIQDSNLSKAWSRAFLGIQRSGQEYCPFLLQLDEIADGEIAEIAEVRNALDDCLAANDLDSVGTVSNTIFPQSLWHQAKGDRSKLYASYLEYLPDYISMVSPSKRGGLYFARLIGFGTKPKDGSHEAHLPPEILQNGGNQLEFIITHCQQGSRRAMLQAAVFDPVRDQTGAAQQAFPCLQHLTFVPHFATKTLSLNAFYASQQLFMKAYGNWLGLVRLGMFVANQTGLRLSTMNCYAGIEKMDKRPKGGAELDRLRLSAEAAIHSS